MGPCMGHTSPSEHWNLEPDFQSPGLRRCSLHSHPLLMFPSVWPGKFFFQGCVLLQQHTPYLQHGAAHTAQSCSHAGVLHASSSAVHHSPSVLCCSQPQGSAQSAVLGALCCEVAVMLCGEVCCCGSTWLRAARLHSAQLQP